ncbi:hypothetical protein QPK31_01545 [Massilia sp. YIM B02769]|uniref:DUF6916 family protein n=1 Tax=unclassified Massilia TaxID=2609279 RepID=UPI0025B6358D|nr:MULTISPECIES: hypothetical protein [unclassified Massilia]MDN4056898.1 hypothetical protein [Massilia sp. YIM B02769]
MSIPSPQLTLPAFAAVCNSVFAVSGLDGVALTLYEALPLAGAAPDEHRFSLGFRSSAAVQLEQGTYTLDHAVLGTLAIFLVPVGRDAGGVQYQAIFN